MKRLSIVWIIALTALLSVAAWSDEVKVAGLKGLPKIMKSGLAEWQDLQPEAIVNSGDRIRTLKGESVEIAFTQDMANMVSIEEDSDVVIAKTDPSQIELLSGEVMSHIKKLPAESTFAIKTPAGVCGARGTGWKTGFKDSRMAVKTFEDKVFIRGIEKSGELMKDELIVREGWEARLERFERPSRLERIAAHEVERWDKWRDSVRERAARIEKTAQVEHKARLKEGPGGEGRNIAGDLQKIREDKREVKKSSDRIGGRSNETRIRQIREDREPRIRGEKTREPKDIGSRLDRLDRKEKVRTVEKIIDRKIEQREARDLRKAENRLSSDTSTKLREEPQ